MGLLGGANVGSIPEDFGFSGSFVGCCGFFWSSVALATAAAASCWACTSFASASARASSPIMSSTEAAIESTSDCISSAKAAACVWSSWVVVAATCASV